MHAGRLPGRVGEAPCSLQVTLKFVLQTLSQGFLALAPRHVGGLHPVYCGVQSSITASLASTPTPVAFPPTVTTKTVPRHCKCPLRHRPLRWASWCGLSIDRAVGVLGAGAKLSLLCVPPTPVTGESPPSLSKELTSTLAGVGDVSFDSDNQFPLDELKIDPLTLDGLHMLNDPDMVLADPATEDTFRMDRL